MDQMETEISYLAKKQLWMLTIVRFIIWPIRSKRNPSICRRRTWLTQLILRIFLKEVSSTVIKHIYMLSQRRIGMHSQQERGYVLSIVWNKHKIKVTDFISYKLVWLILVSNISFNVPWGNHFNNCSDFRHFPCSAIDIKYIKHG